MIETSGKKLAGPIIRLHPNEILWLRELMLL
uniref:Uncharacterized protein n=1 Tax=Polynucleobacter necessarius subsp. necessarius (strain STIR1) TaxID=452638 RepID=B1XVB3_POLNS